MRFVRAGVAIVALAATGLLSTGTAHADDPPHTDIVGGVPATEAYPFIASMQTVTKTDPNHLHCAASLIRPHWVETNAHCVTNDDATAKDPSLYHFRVGSNSRLSGGTVVRPTKIIVYPTWDWLADDGVDNEVGDLALMKLETDVPYPVIPMATRAPAVGTSVRAIGWGVQNADGSGDTPESLYQLDTSVIATNACADGDFHIGKGELCVDTPGSAGTCSGDSGGPLVQKVLGRWVLVGSDSRGISDLCGDGPDVFTDVARFKSWIDTTIAQDEARTSAK